MLPSMRNELVLFAIIMAFAIWYIIRERRLSSVERENRRVARNQWFSVHPIWDRAVRTVKFVFFICACLYPMVAIHNFKENRRLLQHHGHVALLEKTSERSEDKYRLMLYNGTPEYIYFDRNRDGVVSYARFSIDENVTSESMRGNPGCKESSLEPSHGACGTGFYVSRDNCPVKIAVKYWTRGVAPETNVVWVILD